MSINNTEIRILFAKLKHPMKLVGILTNSTPVKKSQIETYLGYTRTQSRDLITLLYVNNLIDLESRLTEEGLSFLEHLKQDPITLEEINHTKIVNSTIPNTDVQYTYELSIFEQLKEEIENKKNIADLVELMNNTSYIKKYQFIDQANYEKETVDILCDWMSRNNLIKRTSGGLRKTNKGVEFFHYLSTQEFTHMEQSNVTPILSEIEQQFGKTMKEIAAIKQFTQNEMEIMYGSLEKEFEDIYLLPSVIIESQIQTKEIRNVLEYDLSTSRALIAKLKAYGIINSQEYITRSGKQLLKYIEELD